MTPNAEWVTMLLLKSFIGMFTLFFYYSTWLDLMIPNNTIFSSFYWFIDYIRFIDIVHSNFFIRIGIPIQFSTFSLLVIYYAHLHHKHKSEWYSFKRKYMTFWFVSNFLFYFLETSMSYNILFFQSKIFPVVLGMSIAHPVKECNEPTWASDFHELFSGTVFLILAAVIGFYGWRVTRVLKASVCLILSFLFINRQRKQNSLLVSVSQKL